MNQEAMTYLDEAMDFIQHKSIMREHINWPILRQEVYRLAEHAQTPAETYSAIEMALAHLEDHHSLFLDPVQEQLRLEGQAKQFGVHAVYPEGIIGIVATGSPAEEAGVHVGDCIETVNGQPLTAQTFWQFRSAFKSTQLDLSLRSAQKGSTYSVRLQATPFQANAPPQGRQLEDNIGYLNIPGFWGNSELVNAYAESVQTIIREVDQTMTCGWVIDLRCNVGGDMWPMVAGVGPILGEGECVSFVAPWEKESVFYRDGQASSSQEGVVAEVKELYRLKRPWPPVAVLTSQLTASSGEFVALAFRGRPRTCSFGEPTRGVPTANDDKKLSDGALLVLTTHLGADRTGQTYDSPLVPDYPIKIGWTQLGSADDPVLLAAIEWLRAEGGCL